MRQCIAIGFAILGMLQPFNAASAQEGKGTAGILVSYETTYTVTVPIVMVELYQDGKLIRTKELDNLGKRGPIEVTWTKLPVGRYEVHFSADGRGTLIKRVILTEEDATTPNRIQVDVSPDKKDVLVGSGASLQAMQDEVKQLKLKIDQLEQEIEKLKKK
jgi:hypothetical protein